jgi:hypothetical protein
MKVAPRRGTGLPRALRPIVPVPQLSTASLSFRSKVPLGNLRRNLDRIVPLATEWVGGIPSGVTPRGSLYQPSSVSHWSGATRAEAVIHSVLAAGANAAILGNSA